MDYFAYISHTKIDQLYEAAAPEAVDEWTERETKERGLDAKASAGLSLAGIAKLFSGEVGYESRLVSEREQKVRVNYLEKLGDVLTAIAAERGEIPSLEECVRTDTYPLYIHHFGQFRVAEPVVDTGADQVLTMHSDADGVSLLLDCSLRYFSTTNEAGELILHSGNWRFFHHCLPLTLETVFVFLNRDGSQVFGSPLYLKVDAAASGRTRAD
jgi:hypothetical protein